ncbi:S8 family peptidase [Caldalkalibacillus salinus]|uniref:S8 family peptidase n=1 Tax=Caldalkalibacillus salinus TaxID=2803787 RepID=UPI0019210838|nr:S8 family peptidase [Caldalkalibacillus salinus]
MRKFLALFLSLTLVLAFAVPSASVANNGEEKLEYLVQFEGPVQKGVLEAFGVDEVLHTYDLIPVALVELTEKQYRGLSHHPQIKAVDHNAEVQALGQTVPWGVPHVQGTAAHEGGHTGSGVKVAILDTGIDNEHEDLAANVKGGYSVFTDDENSDPFYDGNGHGTHVAGTVAAVDNTLGVLGVAHQADLYAVKVLSNSGSGSYAGIAEGIEWAVKNDMDIINMSLGGSSSSSVLEEMCNAAYDAGVLTVAAAGNSGNRGGKGDSVGYPAKYESVIAVAAVDADNQRASFSSTGPAVELAAPGVDVLSTVPNNGYDRYNGTSMASPHVAGVAALVWGAKQGLSNEQLRQLLRDSAMDLGDPNHYGYGLVQAVDAIQQ